MGKSYSRELGHFPGDFPADAGDDNPMWDWSQECSLPLSTTFLAKTLWQFFFPEKPSRQMVSAHRFPKSIPEETRCSLRGEKVVFGHMHLGSIVYGM